MIMKSIADLAREFGCQTDDLRAFAPDDLTTDMRDTDLLSEEIVSRIRAAWTPSDPWTDAS